LKEETRAHHCLAVKEKGGRGKWHLAHSAKPWKKIRKRTSGRSGSPNRLLGKENQGKERGPFRRHPGTEEVRKRRVSKRMSQLKDMFEKRGGKKGSTKKATGLFKILKKRAGIHNGVIPLTGREVQFAHRGSKVPYVEQTSQS